MKRYAKIENEETKQVSVGLGTNKGFYKSIGMVEMEVEQAYNNDWYLAGYVPEKPTPTKEEVSETRKQLYTEQVDPLTAQISRLRDEPQTDELIAEIEALKVERSELVSKIKEENPYPTETKASEVIHDSQQILV